MARILNHLRSNLVGYVALFIALSAGAYAATVAPRNSVVSSSIKNSEVRKADLAESARPATLIQMNAPNGFTDSVVVSPDLTLGLNCGQGGAYILAFVSTAGATGHLSWFFAENGVISSDRVELGVTPPNNEKDFDLEDKRIAGQFILVHGAGAVDEVTTVQLHARGGGGCAVNGTALYVPK